MFIYLILIVLLTMCDSLANKKKNYIIQTAKYQKKKKCIVLIFHNIIVNCDDEFILNRNVQFELIFLSFVCVEEMFYYSGLFIDINYGKN